MKKEEEYLGGFSLLISLSYSLSMLEKGGKKKTHFKSPPKNRFKEQPTKNLYKYLKNKKKKRKNRRRTGRRGQGLKVKQRKGEREIKKRGKKKGVLELG